MILLFIIANSASGIISPMIFALPPLFVMVLLSVPLPSAQHVGVPYVEFRVQEYESCFINAGKICKVRTVLHINNDLMINN